jgi:hypothetical protein
MPFIIKGAVSGDSNEPNSVADPGCLSRIPDLNFFHPGSRVKRFWIPDPDPHQRIKVFVTQKTVFKLSET